MNNTKNSQMLNVRPILIIEDDEASAYYLEEIISEMGGKSLLAYTGQEAMDVLHQNEVSLILMDIRLPDMDGYLLTQDLRNNGVTIPIIAQTAYVMPDDRDKALNSGCNDYLSKPIIKAELSEMLLKYLNIGKYSPSKTIL